MRFFLCGISKKGTYSERRAGSAEQRPECFGCEERIPLTSFQTASGSRGDLSDRRTPSEKRGSLVSSSERPSEDAGAFAPGYWSGEVFMSAGMPPHTPQVAGQLQPRAPVVLIPRIHTLVFQ